MGDDMTLDDISPDDEWGSAADGEIDAVSYTHLTLPTILLV